MIVSIFATLLFIVFVYVIISLRERTNGKYEVKVTDLVAGLIPVLIILLFSGLVKEFQIGDLSVKLQESLEKKVTDERGLMSSTLLDGKRSLPIGTGDCRYAVEQDIIDQRPLLGGATYKYIVFQQNCKDDADDNRIAEFWGIMSFEDYEEVVLSPTSTIARKSEDKGRVLLSWIKSKNILKLKSNIPSFTTVDNAITSETDNLAALQKMESLNVDFLPVVNSEKMFLGVITKERLASNIILSLATDLKK